MLHPLSLFIGLRYTLTRRRNRSVSFISAIAMTGIVLGVALLITVLSVMNGFDRELRQRILGIMPQVTVYHQEGIADWAGVRSRIMQQDDVTGAAPFVELQGMLYQGREAQPVLIYGLAAELTPTVSAIGRYLGEDTLGRLNDSDGVIAIGQGIAEKLAVVEGDALTLIVPSPDRQKRGPKIRRLSVIAVFATGTEVDHKLALMGLTGAAATAAAGRVSGFHLRVNNLFRAPVVAGQLNAWLPHGYYTTDWTRTHGNLYTAIQMSKNLVVLLLLLIIAIAAFNVVSTLVMVVVDKQSDIGVLRTLGMSRRQIMAIFTVQGMIIGVVGTGIGVLLGIGLSLSIESVVAGVESLLGVKFLQSDIYPVSFLPAFLLWSDVLLVGGLSLLMSSLATLYPARKAAGIQPAEVLRYD